ncbi:MAG: DUF4935 domain-containing protein, partial [Acidobacteriales bacterium]|nr:DUF4935 domain-containing protein [Terriglobales bacterium]
MLHVIIDTSIYRQDPRREKSAFRALTRLCKGKKVKLHVPEFVRREFVSQQQQLIEKDILAAKKGAESMIKKSPEGAIAEHANVILAEVESSFEMAWEWADNEFESWLKQCEAVEHEMTLEHVKQMTEDYFDGKPPFSSVKERKDMPDSIIFQAIRDLAGENEKLYVVVNDGALLKASTAIKNISGFPTLDAFIETAECQEALEELDSETLTNNIARAKAMIIADEEELKKTLFSELESELHGKTVTSRSIPDDNNEGTIYGVHELNDVTFDFAAREYYGEGEIGIPFEASVDCELNYAMFKSE